MMMNAYREIYLNSAMRNIGTMFDFAINDLGLPAEDYTAMFLASKICRKLENGEPKYLVGMSGIELAMDIIEEKTGLLPEPVQEESMSDTPDYWCGWALCYYQWLRNLPYKRILAAVSYDELRSMYLALHEADISKFADVMDKRCLSGSNDTRLKTLRKAGGYSQSGLAKRSGVSLRSIQMYEQRNKDINKGQSETLLRLARAIGCNIEDLLEPQM